MSNIKYQYAYDENQHLISIADVTEENRKEHQYVCIGCGNPLLPRAIKSQCRRPHFYHKQDVSCSGETYLHKLAKRMFKERFDRAEHFRITYCVNKICSVKGCALRNIQCRIDDCTITVDLKQYYDTCQEEVPINGFVADILLTNSKKNDLPPILVEVCVSHPCEPEKRNSRLKIIELNVQSEEDIKALLGRNHLKDERRSMFEPTVSGVAEFISFKRNLPEKLQVPIARYVLVDDDSHQTGYITFQPCSKAQYKIRTDAKELNIYRTFKTSREINYYEAALRWLYDKYRIKRCNLCKFYYATDYEQFPSCRLWKKCGTPMYPYMQEAESCRCFRLEEIYPKSDYLNGHLNIVEVKEVSPDKKTPFKVIVAGSKGFLNYQLFKEKCDYYLSSKIETHDVSILFGTSRDTESLIRGYCKERSITFEPFDANWAMFGKSAPQECINIMLDFANAAIVFWDGKSKYTKDIIDAAQNKNIRVVVIKVNV